MCVSSELSPPNEAWEVDHSPELGIVTSSASWVHSLDPPTSPSPISRYQTEATPPSDRNTRTDWYWAVVS